LGDADDGLMRGVDLAGGGEEVGVDPSVELARDTEDAEGARGTRSTGGDMDTGVGEGFLGVHRLELVQRFSRCHLIGGHLGCHWSIFSSSSPSHAQCTRATMTWCPVTPHCCCYHRSDALARDMIVDPQPLKLSLARD
jgi:hypothetical protein